jgi:hypothetical protein
MNDAAKLLPVPEFADELCPSRFIASTDFKGKKPVFTIIDIHMEELESQKGKEVKGILTFRETDKKWVINKTNLICCINMFGRRLADWKGKRVALWAAPYQDGTCIRVYGSPDIPEDREITVALKRKAPRQVMLRGAKRSTATTGPEREPGSDDNAGESA